MPAVLTPDGSPCRSLFAWRACTAGPSAPAFICRSLALSGIFFQFRLFAGDLSDTALFLTSLGAAFLIPLLLKKFRRVSVLQGVAVLVLLPWAIRLLLALPRVLDRKSVV
jgi:hypothetical protein